MIKKILKRILVILCIASAHRSSHLYTNKDEWLFVYREGEGAIVSALKEERKNFDFNPSDNEKKSIITSEAKNYAFNELLRFNQRLKKKSLKNGSDITQARTLFINRALDHFASIRSWESRYKKDVNEPNNKAQKTKVFFDTAKNKVAQVDQYIGSYEQYIEEDDFNFVDLLREQELPKQELPKKSLLSSLYNYAFSKLSFLRIR